MIKYEAMNGRVCGLTAAGNLPEISADISALIHLIYINFKLREPIMAEAFREAMTSVIASPDSPMWEESGASDGEYVSAMFFNRPEGRGKP